MTSKLEQIEAAAKGKIFIIEHKGKFFDGDSFKRNNPLFAAPFEGGFVEQEIEFLGKGKAVEFSESGYTDANIAEFIQMIDIRYDLDNNGIEVDPIAD